MFGVVEDYAPGFTDSVIGRDILTPLELERVFGLPKGNIMHSSISLCQLGYVVHHDTCCHACVSIRAVLGLKMQRIRTGNDVVMYACH